VAGVDLGLDGKVVLVTGASEGIGRAVAEAFAREGGRLVLLARRADRLEAAAAAVRALGAETLAVPADVTRPADVSRAVDAALNRFGAVHVLVNNVGGSLGTLSLGLEEIDDAQWSAVFEQNVFSAVRVTRAVLPPMRRQGWGRIIFIASESGIQPDPTGAPYNAAKAAVIALAKTLSKAHAAEGILVNTVSPAFVRTPAVSDMLRRYAERAGISAEAAEAAFLTRRRPHIEVRRPGSPEEVAAAVVFLASEAAAFINGANLRVDGGSVASV
jgi:3-oxoacyl-[acyl-carrier protein] reductase